MSYAEFLERKAIVDPSTGLSEVPTLNPMLFPFQHDIVAWALRRGRAAIFADCGMGKTPMQLEWAKHIPGRVLILAPLAVAQQTVHEGEKFGIDVQYRREGGSDLGKITITNYEMLPHFDASMFAGVVLDESSILKAYDGKTRTQIIESFAKTPFRLACTATPAPNDYMELGNHSEFLGVMSRTEMLSMFFVHDGGETQKWRIKGHAQSEFWRWLCSWAVMIRKPSDLGYEDGEFILPPINYHAHNVSVDKPTEGQLFIMPAATLQERIGARRDTVTDRVAHCAALVNGSLSRKDDKLSEWHAPNQTTNGDITQSTEPEGSRNLSHTSAPMQNIERATCDPITRPTKSSGRAALKNSVTDITTQGAKNTPPIQFFARNSAPYPEAEMQTASGTEGLNRTTESLPPSGILSSLNSKEAALSAGAQIHQTTQSKNPATENAASTLTTITQRGEFEDSCVQIAISDSESSETMRRDYGEQWIIWTNLNDEANKCAASIPGSVNVQGSHSREFKERAVKDFSSGKIRVLISKVSIFGFGLNLQCCHNVAFVGLSDSYEAFYQAIRRCWRFGQKHPVNVHIITAETEGFVVDNIERKEKDAEKMSEEMLTHMQDLNKEALKGATVRGKTEYARDVASGENWTLHLADCVEVAKEIPDNSLHFSVFSPPFSSLYTYSNSDRDMGNCADDAVFMEHFGFLISELYRALMPGRLVSFHCMNLPTSKTHHGWIGVRDFRGDLIRLFESHGFIYHSEVCIWKDPVTAMQRTKALGLLHKQLKKDSCMSRQGIPDYLVTMRKPGDNPEPVSHTNESFPVQVWQRYASPVWMDINPSDTLQFRSAREHNDERHICPLQLQVIERALELWSNPGDTVFSPFAGIGSEGYVAIKMGRRFVGAELKRSYWEQACRNLQTAHSESGDLFAESAA